MDVVHFLSLKLLALKSGRKLAADLVAAMVVAQVDECINKRMAAE